MLTFTFLTPTCSSPSSSNEWLIHVFPDAHFRYACVERTPHTCSNVHLAICVSCACPIVRLFCKRSQFWFLVLLLHLSARFPFSLWIINQLSSTLYKSSCFFVASLWLLPSVLSGKECVGFHGNYLSSLPKYWACHLGRMILLIRLQRRRNDTICEGFDNKLLPFVKSLRNKLLLFVKSLRKNCNRL